MISNITTVITCLASLVSAGSIIVMVEQYHLASKTSRISLERDKDKMAIRAIKAFHKGMKIKDQNAKRRRHQSKHPDLDYLNDVISFINEWAVFVNNDIVDPDIIRQAVGYQLADIKRTCQPVIRARERVDRNKIKNYLRLMKPYDQKK